MKIVTLTDEEEKLVAKLRRDALRAKSGEQSAEVVRAAGTSEGAKKGWEERLKGFQATAHSDTTRAWVADNIAKTWKGEEHKTVAWEAHSRAASSHDDAANAARKAGDKDSESFHSEVASSHRKSMAEHSSKTKATDTADSDVVHCRASSATGPQLGASQPWNPGERVEFMWMPAGVSTICAGFRKGSIELTVQCDEATAAAVQASLDGWREERPKQEPFGCIEHKEQEASFRVGASCGFKWNGDGVYLAAEPTTLGAQNVNGRVHRSWSPSFTTDADYARASEQPPKSGVLVFPEGVRGSRSNPARITGVDFCVGTLTNKPAFHSMSPVKAKEADSVTAAGTSEGVKKGWETRNHGLSADAHKATVAAYEGPEESRINLHTAAMNAHSEAAVAHSPESKMRAAHIDSAGYHGNVVAALTRGHKGDLSRSSIHDFLSKCKATDATASAAVTAHCAAQLVQDVPDATEAETAAYEAAMDKGSGHAQAVQELRAARVAKLSASEPPTADTIAAAYEAAVAEANRIAASQGAAKLTASDVWEQFSVKAVWSDAARKASAEARRHKVGDWVVHPKTSERGVVTHVYDDNENEHGKLIQVDYNHMSGVGGGLMQVNHRQSHVEKSKDQKSKWGKEQSSYTTATDATPEAILEQIYARAGANR